MNTDFIELRMRALQRWADKLARHAGLAQADAVKKFLVLSNEQFAAMRDGSRSRSSAVVAAAGSGVVRLIKATASSISSAVTGSGSSGPKSKSAEDLSFEELENYLYNQGPLLTGLYNNATSVAMQYREQAQYLLDYGAALRALGVSEGDALGNSLGAAGLATWAASTAAYEQAVQESELWVERLADLVRGIKCIKNLLGERARASTALADSLALVEKYRSQVSALSANPSASAAADKAKIEAELVNAQTAVTEARAYYDKVAASVIAEVERYRIDLRDDFRAMLLDFANTQVRNNLKVSQAWEKAAPECANAVALEGATPIPTGATAVPAVTAGAGSEPLPDPVFGMGY